MSSLPGVPMLRACCVVLSLTAGVAPAAGLKAGAAKCDITPPTGLPMWGYAARRDAPAKDVRDKLHARALVIEADGTRMALVSLDLGRAPTRDSSTRILARIKKDSAVSVAFLCASHTHHGPAMEMVDLPTPKTSYVRALEDKLVALVADAVKELRPAKLAVVSRNLNLNRNRHSKLAEKVTDPTLTVMRLEDAAGKPIAHAVNFAAHPTMLPMKDYRWSADYVGVFAARVEKETSAPCVFLQGAAGDMSPNTTDKVRTPEAFGELLAKEVLALAKAARCRDVESPTLKSAEDDFRFACRVALDNPLIVAAMNAAFFPGLVAHFKKEYADGVRPRLTTAVLGGNIGFVGVSGEVFSSHAVQLRRRARLEHLFFVGYCNDYHQYFPTIEAFAEGGYGTEVYIGTAEVGAGERVMDKALFRLWGLRGKVR